MSKPSSRKRLQQASQTRTLADVAKLVGVTKITISRALNDPDRVSPKTLARVREAVRRTGYVPNLVAGSLSSNRSRLVVALVPTVAGSVFIPTVQALADRLSDGGYQLLLGQAGYDDPREDALLEAIIGRRPDGIVLTGIVHSAQARRRLRAARIPVVETWELTPKPIDMLVGFSHSKIGAAAAERLHARGRRRLAVITPNDRRARIRADAFVAAAMHLGGENLKPVPVLEVAAPTPMGEGRAALRDLLARVPDVDGVYCGSDTLALGLLIEAKARAIAVPDQLAVMGYGDLPFAKDTDPPLTTIRIDGETIGKHAADMLIARIKGGAAARRVVDVGFTIIERATA
ncbi:MAG TPA: LacI family DNA-binding transcriptional regulator [Alphaproteobacteria bacterium]|nr:LacI family DNA-binding transcriptional regulator [Alphaproteobacteria bacterium]